MIAQKEWDGMKNTLNDYDNKCTCIINVKNGAQYIKQAILSVLNQSVKVEILIIDNYSTDNTLQVTREISNKIKIIQPSAPCSLGKARNFGLSLVTTPYVAWLDADDVWHHPNFVQLHLEILESDINLAFVSSGGIAIDCNGHFFIKKQPWLALPKLNPSIIDGYSRYKLMENMSFIGPWCSFMFRTNLVNRTGGFNDNYAFAEDYDLLIKLLNYGNSMHINKNLCQYRFHENQATKTLPLDVIFGEIKEVLINNSSFLPTKDFLKLKKLTDFNYALKKLIRNEKTLLFTLSSSLVYPFIWGWLIRKCWIFFLSKYVRIIYSKV